MRVVIPHGQATPSNLLALDAMIRQALHLTGTTLASKITSWERLPHLHPHRQADTEACRLFGTGTKGLAFATTVRSTLVDHDIDGLKPARSGGDETVLRMPLNDQFALRLVFDRSPQFFGHGFTLMLGFEPSTGPAAGCVWRDFPAFALLGREGWPPAWIFETKFDLQESVAGVAALLRAILPPLRAAFDANVDPTALLLPPTIDDRTGIAARQAFELASPLAAAWNGQSRLESIVSDETFHLRVIDLRTVALDATGRLSRFGSWRFNFWSPTCVNRLAVRVPSLGPMTCGVSEPGINIHPFSDQLSIPDNWIDSDQAITAITPFVAGEEALRTATHISMKLDVDQFRGHIGRPLWNAYLHLAHGRIRHDAFCDAVTGLPATRLATDSRRS